jgi:hypothetical protein
MRLLVVIPCRDEAAVIARRLANLARAAWPARPRPHRIAVVDDGSRDGTAERARAAGREVFGGRADVELCVLANPGPAGKPGAVRAGLAGAGEFDLAVLTDADVVNAEEALVELARAFEREPRLALATGTQRFVRDLAADGSPCAADGGPLADASAAWDRWTARARALESRFGSVFSVHGQLLAWRAALGLAPAIGVAADDLDLMLAVRARACEPRRIEQVREALFAEVKTPDGPAARAQAQRRARAWFQALWRSSPPAGGPLELAQWLLYRHAPTIAPELSLVAPAVLVAAAGLALGPAAALGTGLSFAALACTPLGRRWIRLMGTIAAARSAERRSPLPDAWEMSRT